MLSSPTARPMTEPWNVRKIPGRLRWIVEATCDTQDVAIVEQKYDAKKKRSVLWCWACWKDDCADAAAVSAFMADAHIDSD